jgi:hypothetical protein
MQSRDNRAALGELPKLVEMQLEKTREEKVY